ncbi:DNA polymerase III, subunit delta [Gottschalkia purinilytica]|uniref:DNA polymerase III subunit delta n=1 Tax=Gottschalkia purinilytica TaxID=1503 RepID=A0A0L0WD12_GOTPU|nr:DNA polymerase III subunit delta [Gottschalkia purinilytica]KNF09369.1 DNA polymerase III, subunit delta [Gottschalkia purinilytica]
MSYKDFLRDVEKNELKKVYLIFGKEMYLKDMLLSTLKNKYIDKAFESLNYIHMDGKSISSDMIINACETLPFMADKKIVVVEDLSSFKSGNKEGNFSGEEDLIKYIPKISDFCCLVFIIKEDKVDSRKKIVKSIKKEGLIVQLDKLKDEELNKWVIDIFKKNNKKLVRNVLIHFIQCSSYFDTNTNKTLYDLENEIFKICNYMGEREEVTKEDIDKMITKSLQNNIFKLVDFIGQRNSSNALSVFNEMIMEDEPLQVILHMVIRQFRLLLMTKLLNEKGYSQGNIAQKIGIHTFVVQKLTSQCRNFNSDELTNILKACMELDQNIKTGKVDGKIGIEILIVEISNKIKKIN